MLRGIPAFVPRVGVRVGAAAAPRDGVLVGRTSFRTTITRFFVAAFLCVRVLCVRVVSFFLTGACMRVVSFFLTGARLATGLAGALRTGVATVMAKICRRPPMATAGNLTAETPDAPRRAIAA